MGESRVEGIEGRERDGDELVRRDDVSVAPERWLNVDLACAEVKVTRRTIYNWFNAGRLVTRRTTGGSLRILASSLRRKP